MKAIFVQIRRAKSIAAIHVTMSQSVSFCLWECRCNRADRSGDLSATRHLVLIGTWCSQAAGAHRHLVLAVQIVQVVLESRHQLVAKSGLTLLVLVVLKYL